VSAFAQSSVSITGLIDTGYKTVNYGNTTADTKGLAANNTATTVLTLAGTEDLGGGLAANFQLQLTPDFINGAGVESTTAVGNGQQAFVGLSSAKAGSLKLGRVNTNTLDAWGVGSVFGTALGSGYSTNGNIFTRFSKAGTGTSNTAPTRFNGAIRYESPVFNGFSASYLAVPQATDVDAQSVSDFGLKYSNGPLNVAYANMEIKQNGTVAADKSFIGGGSQALTTGTSNKISILSANYTIGAATVYGATFTEKQNTSTEINTSGSVIGAKYVMGATTLMASMGSSNEKSAANADKKIAGIGADYALSKRTNAYVRYETKDGNKNDTANDKVTTTAFGIKHTF
jgi:predicted porin